MKPGMRLALCALEHTLHKQFMLSLGEAAILRHLVEHANEPCRVSAISGDTLVGNSSIPVLMCRIREKLADMGLGGVDTWRACAWTASERRYGVSVETAAAIWAHIEEAVLGAPRSRAA